MQKADGNAFMQPYAPQEVMDPFIVGGLLHKAAQRTEDARGSRVCNIVTVSPVSLFRKIDAAAGVPCFEMLDAEVRSAGALSRIYACVRACST